MLKPQINGASVWGALRLHLIIWGVVGKIECVVNAMDQHEDKAFITRPKKMSIRSLQPPAHPITEMALFEIIFHAAALLSLFHRLNYRNHFGLSKTQLYSQPSPNMEKWCQFRRLPDMCALQDIDTVEVINTHSGISISLEPFFSSCQRMLKFDNSDGEVGCSD